MMMEQDAFGGRVKNVEGGCRGDSGGDDDGEGKAERSVIGKSNVTRRVRRRAAHRLLERDGRKEEQHSLHLGSERGPGEEDTNKIPIPQLQ